MSPVLGVKEQGQGRVRGGGVPDAVHSAVPSASRRHWSSRGSRDERASAPQRGRRAGSRLIALDGRSEDEQGAAAVCMAVWMGTSTRSRGETLRGI
jgi:hypothetical protein